MLFKFRSIYRYCTIITEYLKVQFWGMILNIENIMISLVTIDVGIIMN